MCDRGNPPVLNARHLPVIGAVISLSLLLAWPVAGAGQGGGGSRGAFSLAWRVEGKATLVVEPRPRG